MDFFDTVLSDQDRQRRERSVDGISIAKVTGRMNDGTYAVQFLGMGGDTPSAPARMMMPNAGSKRGMYWMPEIGDEVVVAFEGGDSNAPIILGALFNSQSPTPEQAKPSNENNIRTLVSRTGHEVTFDDSPSAGKVTVKTKEGLSLMLDDTPPGTITMDTPKGISIVMDEGTGTLTIKAPVSIVMESASLALNVGGMSVAPGAAPGTGTFQITAPAAVSIQSGASISLNAATIALTTTGTMPTCAVIIDGKPFGAHVHGLPLPSPPVTPPVQP
jgi:phage baseplate assembly protein gpV